MLVAGIAENLVTVKTESLEQWAIKQRLTNRLREDKPTTTTSQKGRTLANMQLSVEHDCSIARDDSLSFIGVAGCRVEPMWRTQPFNLKLRPGFPDPSQQNFIHEGNGRA